ncbi:hypothetical protein [Pyrobaculum aerophilum]|uniref:hypothetical protein n=1 Tax=Pyrobaculum aerophilum TaxID=13773 RepID=UPI0023F0EF58|nr:hypothetical protein [Pyrobaculum aerophilum]MCX8136500.1 hypothetical protein [Pyrobaculum aerophilum]
MTRLASWFEMGLKLTYKVETGIPRTDKAQEARGSMPYAAQWGDPKPLLTEYVVGAYIRYNAPTQWYATVDNVEVKCEYYNATTGQKIRETTIYVKVAKDVHGVGWESKFVPCGLQVFNEKDEGQYQCTANVPWYGKNTVEPGDFGAQYWWEDSKPQESQFGQYEMGIDHVYSQGENNALRFYIMSGLAPGQYNQNIDGTTDKIYMKKEYFDFVWFITGGRPEVEIKWGRSNLDGLLAAFRESRFVRTFGEKSEVWNQAPGVVRDHTIQTVGIPFRFDLDARVLPPEWMNIRVGAPKNTIPTVRYALYSLANTAINGARNWYVFKGYDPRTCVPTNTTQYYAVGLTPDHLQNARGGSVSYSNYILTELVKKDIDAKLKEHFVIVSHIWKKHNSTCYGFAVAYVVATPQGSTTAYVGKVAVQQNGGTEGYWYVPLGGIGKERFSAEYNLEFMGQKASIVAGKEGIELVRIPARFEQVGNAKSFFRWVGIRAASWPYVWLAAGDESISDFRNIGSATIVFTPTAEITFGSTPIEIETPVGLLKVPSSVVPNAYATEGLPPYYYFSFGAQVTRFTSAATDWSYTPSNDFGVVAPVARFYVIGTNIVGSVIQNLGYHNRDNITSAGNRYVVYIHNAERLGGPFDGLAVPGGVTYHDVHPAVQAPPPPPSNDTGKPDECDPTIEICDPIPPPPSPSGFVALWLVPVVPCGGVYCTSVNSMFVGYVDQYAFPGRSYALVVAPASTDGKVHDVDVEIYVEAKAVRDGNRWRTARGGVGEFLYFKGKLRFTPEGGQYYLVLPNRTLPARLMATVNDVGYFITPEDAGTCAREYRIRVKYLNKEEVVTYHVTRAVLNATYYTPLLGQVDYVKPNLRGVVKHDLCGRTAYAAYRPEFLMHSAYTEVATRPLSWVMAVDYAHIMPTYALTDLLSYAARYYPVSPGAADSSSNTLRLSGDVAGWAVYLYRGGTWRRVQSVNCSNAVLDLSQVWPWDPVMVVPLVRARFEVRSGDSLTLPWPQAALYARWNAPLAPYGTPSQPRLYCS